MNFKIDIPIATPDSSLEISHRFLFAGSCFAENISAKMNSLMMNQEFLYHGILFNPISLANAFQQILDEVVPENQSIIDSGGIYQSWNHHGSIFDYSLSALQTNIAAQNKRQKSFLKDCNYLLISFGSAYVYELIETKKIVANCHKVPSKFFHKRLLSIEEIVKSWQETIDQILHLNPKLQIIFTVSPVKYLKDGVHENNLSKSILHLAIHELVQNQQCRYFPAFEILQDELRDYRFYAQDMAHPTEQAVQYIWEKFVSSQFSPQSREAIKEINQYSLMKSHRILHEGSKEHHQFIEHLQKTTTELKLKYPFLKWE